MGGNGGPPLDDPLILKQVFPGLRTASGGSILSVADNIFDVTGPSQRLTTQMHEAYTQRLIEQIRVADPEYRFQSLGVPSTAEGAGQSGSKLACRPGSRISQNEA
jgi:hypothetical protein